jgi:hypothetical protein
MSRSGPGPFEQSTPEQAEGTEPEDAEKEAEEDRSAVPLAIRHSLREILGAEGEHVEKRSSRDSPPPTSGPP